MAGPSHGLCSSKWAPEHLRNGPPPLIPLRLHSLLNEAAPLPSPSPQQIPRLFHMQDPEDLIRWDSEFPQEDEAEQEPDMSVTWDFSDDPIEWEANSDEDGEDEEFSDEETSTVASTPSKDPSVQPLMQAPALLTPNPVQAAKPNNLFASRWATLPEDQAPKLNTSLPRRPPPSAAPVASLRPIQDDARFNGGQSMPPAGFQPRAPVFQVPTSIDRPPGYGQQQHVVQAPQMAPPMLRPQHSQHQAALSHSKPQAQQSPAKPQIAGLSSKPPAYLDYPIAPGVSSYLIGNLRDFGDLVYPQNTQIDGDGDKHPEHDRRKSDTLTEQEKAERNRLLHTHAKHLKKFLANTKVGIDIAKCKAEMTINQQKAPILQLIKANSAVVIAAATGSGKTTQLPQIILEDAIESGQGADCNVWVTQPRRVAAVTVCRRVRKERNDGEVISVGYHVKFDVMLPKAGGCVTYCTTGILLNRIQRRPGEVFDNVSHIIVDEAHERDMIIDRLLAVLKWQLFDRKRQGLKFPKIIISSATLDIDLFTKFFSQPFENRGLVPCPYLNIPGRMFPVQNRYLTQIMAELRSYSHRERSFLEKDKSTTDFLQIEVEKRNAQGRLMPMKPTTEMQNALVPISLIALTVAHIIRTSTEGAILVFLPGIDHITKVMTALQVNSPLLGADFNDKERFRIVILHGEMKELQDEAFEVMRNGCRKIVLATNIAETSVTIPDAVYVIDSGKHKEIVYDPQRGLSSLQCEWISKSSCRQRAGRSGRVQNGYYCAMYTEQRYDAMRDTTPPEILRSDLQEVCLQLADQPFGGSVREFLNRMIETPNGQAIDAALNSLKGINALTEDEQITSLGRILASLPVHPALAKMILLGVIFRCLDPMLILAAASGMKDMFQRPLERRTESKACRIEFSGNTDSDHMALISACGQARYIAEKTGSVYKCRKFLEKNFISFNQWRDLTRTAEQMEQILIDRRLIPWHVPGGAYWKYGPSELNQNADNPDLVKALIIAGFHPNVAASHGTPMLRTLHAQRVLMSGASVNSGAMARGLRGQLYAFSGISKNNDGMTWSMRDNSTISPLACIVFGRSLECIGEQQVLVDGWLLFNLPSKVEQTALARFKTVIDNVLADTYKQLGIAGEKMARNPIREKLSDIIAHVLQQDKQMYDQWLQNQPSIPVGPKRRRKNKPRKNKPRH